jgi:NADH-quinone oxidoreductase subunit K
MAGVLSCQLAAGLGAFLAPLAQTAPPATGDEVGLSHYLVTSAIVFGLGVLIILTRRNAIAVLMGLELLLNAGAINFVAFSKYASPDAVDGQVITLFVIVIAAAEAALALAITLNLFNNLNTIEIDEARSLKG